MVTTRLTFKPFLVWLGPKLALIPWIPLGSFVSYFILNAFPQTRPLVPPLVWMMHKTTQGLTVVSLTILVVLVASSIALVCRRLISRPEVTPVFSDLGNTTVRSNQADIEALNSTAAPSVTAFPPLAMIVFGILFSTFVILLNFYLDGTVFTDESLFDNLASLLKYILEGLEVIFATLTLCLAIFCICKRWELKAIAEAPRSDSPSTTTPVTEGTPDYLKEGVELAI